jgi:hypothetical protein
VDGGGVAGRQRAPLAPDYQDLQRTLEDLVLVGQARTYVRLRGLAVRRELPLHLRQLSAMSALERVIL